MQGVLLQHHDTEPRRLIWGYLLLRSIILDCVEDRQLYT